MQAKGSLSGDPESTVRKTQRLQERLKAARGDSTADLVIKNAKWLDVFTGCFQTGDVAVFDGVIIGVKDTYDAKEVVDGSGCYIVPGFIDAHVHVESSMMTPDRFASAVLRRGTTTVIWDPHEIANVKGVDGIRWALDASENQPIDFFVMIPSCVPSTSPSLGLESSGAELVSRDLEQFVGHPRVLGLAEMMNWPGLVGGDEEVMEKLTLFSSLKRDGHCPGLSGKALNAYGVAGIHSCHESTTWDEGSEKLSKGIHVLIREGSCAKDADVLLPLLNQYSSATLGYCSDDRNPLDIEESGHLDCIINKALSSNLDPVAVFRAASFAVAKMYGLDDRGAIAPGYRADMVMLKPRSGQKILSQGMDIVQVWQGGRSSDSALSKDILAKKRAIFPGKNLNMKKSVIGPEDFAVRLRPSINHRISDAATVRVIGVRPGQIVTDTLTIQLPIKGDSVHVAIDSGVNKISVIERHHQKGFMASGLVKGFDLKSGAIATSINHDCHNVIVTGSSDVLMAQAVEALRDMDGGIVVVGEDGRKTTLPLPIGGLMTDAEPGVVAETLRALKSHAREIGCKLHEPFLQLSFLALPVIPSLKITDRGLVDGVHFKIVPVEI